MGIKMIDSSVLNSNIKRGFLYATCDGNMMPNSEVLHLPI